MKGSRFIIVRFHLERTKKFFLIVSAFFLLSGCSNKTFDNEEELFEFIKEESNGFIQHKNVNGIDFTLLYKPTDLLVKQELGSAEIADSKRIEELRSKYNKYMYFNLSMSMNNKELLSVAPNNRNEFGAMVNQLAFGMREKVFVYTQKKDTLEMADYIYPRMYGMSKSTSMLFVYPRKEKHLKETYLNFTIDDLGTYTGEVKFKIPTNKINKEPSLSFKN